MSRLHIVSIAFAAAVLALAGCQGGSDSGQGTVTVNGDVPLVYAKRVNTLALAPTNGTPSAPGGDLMLREKSSPQRAGAQPHRGHHAGQRRRVRPRGVLRRQEDRLRAALPDHQQPPSTAASRPAPGAGTSGNTT